MKLFVTCGYVKQALVQGQHLFPVKHKEQLSYKWNW